MNKKCTNCRLANYPDAEFCIRCKAVLTKTIYTSPRKNSLPAMLVRRVIVLFIVCAAVIAGFYASLVFSAPSLSYDERKTVKSAIDILEEKGFSDEVFLLRYAAVYRSADNWLNSSVVKESAFAATNYPFEIVTVYPDFFTYPADSTEQAAILLHESRHLMGEDEAAAYKYVWKNRKRLGWTSDKYRDSAVWKNVRRQTTEFSPDLFVCDFNEFSDCTEN